VSEMKGREWHNCFYIGSLNHKATSWAWFPLCSKVLQITYQDYTFEQRNTPRYSNHKNLAYNLARITLTDLESHQVNKQRH